MQRGTFVSALFVIALISIDITVSVSFAKSKITIYKVTKVSPGNKLRLRAWPSTKSRVKVSLPHNAKSLTETGKSKVVNGTRWVEVKWKKTQGWVSKNYLKKTGVLLKSNKNQLSAKSVKSRNKASKPVSKKKASSRNTRSIKSKTIRRSIDPRIEVPPQEFGGDRYDQTIEKSAKEVKVSRLKKNKIRRKLSCLGNTPKPWSMKLDVNGNTMSIRFPGKKALNVPLRYNEWTSLNKTRVNLGGSRGRNTVADVNLERTNACRITSSNKRFRYEIKTTINNKFYSGCCR